MYSSRKSLRSSTGGWVLCLVTVFLFGSSWANAQAGHRYSHCVQALPYLTKPIQTEYLHSVESLYYSKFCKDGRVSMGIDTAGSAGIPYGEGFLEAAGQLFAQYGNQERFCKMKHGQDRDHVYVRQSQAFVASMAFTAYRTCLRLTRGGFQISPHYTPGARRLGVAIEKTSADMEKIRDVTFFGMQQCVLDDYDSTLEPGINKVDLEVADSAHLTLTHLRHHRIVTP